MNAPQIPSADRSDAPQVEWPTEKPPINWLASTVFAATTVIALISVPWYGLTHGFSTATVIGALVLVALNGIGITAGYHRLWSHRAYEAHWTVRLVFMIFGTMAIQNSIMVWCANHRVHHRFVDNDNVDPYSAGRGFWFSHIGWMLREWPSGAPDFNLVRDIEKDPLVAFQHKHYIPLVLITNFGIPSVLGLLLGDFWGMIFLGGFLRLVISHHVTFFINSLAHLWGTQPYNDKNSAKDNPWLAFLTYGEGYHNFHHHFVHDYRNAIRWWQWDPTKWLIWSLSKVGLATRLRRTPDVVIQRARVEMQFRRLEAARANASPTLAARVQAELEAFKATIAEWSRVMDLRANDFKRFRARSREIVRELRQQRRRLVALTAA